MPSPSAPAMPSPIKALAWVLLMGALLGAGKLEVDASAVLTDQATVPDNTFTTTNVFP